MGKEISRENNLFLDFHYEDLMKGDDGGSTNRLDVNSQHPMTIAAYISHPGQWSPKG